MNDVSMKGKKLTVFAGIVALLLSLSLLCILSLPAYAAQPLETETARLLEAGSFRVETTFEFQTSSQGKEYAVPLAFTYGLRNDLELVAVLLRPGLTWKF